MMAVTCSFRNVSVSQLKAFVAAAELGGFSKAAENVGRSQPAITQMIRNMEDALGLVLFERHHRGATLSQQGSAVLPSARRLLRSHTETLERMAPWQAGARSTVSIAGSVSVMRIIMPSLLNRLGHDYPGVGVRASEGLSCEVERQICTGEAALGVSVGDEDNPALRYTQVLRAQFGLLVAPGFHAPEGLDSLSVLNTLNMVRMCDQSSGVRVLRQHCPGLTGYFGCPIVVDHMPAALDLVHRFGYATLATGLGATYPTAQGLRFIPLPSVLPETRVHLVSRREGLFNKSDESMREAMRECIHRAPWHASVHRVGRSLGA